MSADPSSISASVPPPPPAAGASAAVFERRQYGRALAGNVVPAQAWRRVGELDALLDEVNGLYAQAEAEIAQAREKGYADGFAEGLARVQQQMTEHLAALNERRARVLADASGRITELACAIVARIAPDFDARRVVPPLVMQAVEAAQAEQFLMIRVHPTVREDVAAGLGAVRQAHPAVGVIELVDDLSLDPLSCVVVSEAGEVRAGVAQQIEAIRTALAGVGSHAA
jgi:flagellar biosynthesis/type III secretory pathway protein FliH